MRVDRNRLEKSIEELGRIGHDRAGGEGDRCGVTDTSFPAPATMAAIGPAGMIFVPSHDGRSHCEEEFTPMDDIEHGTNRLFTAALELAGQA